MTTKNHTKSRTAAELAFSGFPAMMRKRAAEENDVFCILDAAADGSIHPLLKNSDWEYRCLYKKGVHFEGARMVDSLAATAPYLLRLDPGKVAIESFFSRRLGRNLAVFFQSKASIQELTEHFSGLLKAADEEGNIFGFRYFDPRILRIYLPSCTEEEKRVFYGPAEVFWAEGEEGAMLEFHEKDEEIPETEEAKPQESKPKDGEGGYGIFAERKNPGRTREEPLTGFGMIGEFSQFDGTAKRW
jgi:hypothetical protein